MKIYELLEMDSTEDFLAPYEVVSEEDLEQVDEAVTRQLRRYGNKTKLQYRCQDGDKKGRLVSQPSGCGIRKDPTRVRAGKRSSRIRKGERVRKSNMTKRRTLTKNLMRRNKMFKGPTAKTVLNKGDKKSANSSSNIKSVGSEGTKDI